MTIIDYLDNKIRQFIENAGLYEHVNYKLIENFRCSLKQPASKNIITRNSLMRYILCNDTYKQYFDLYKLFLEEARTMKFDPLIVYYCPRKDIDKIYNITAHNEFNFNLSLIDRYKVDEDKNYYFGSYDDSIILHQTEFGKIKFVKIQNSMLPNCSKSFRDVIRHSSARFCSSFFTINSNKEYNYVSVTSDGKVTYLPADKVKTVHHTKYYDTSLRKSTTIGRFIQRHFKGEFTDSEIEEISNNFKSHFEEFTVEIWDSNKIKDAYLEDNYGRMGGNENNILANSCMRYKKCQKYMKFYEKAGTQIAVALDRNNKVIVRALLWKVGEDLYFLDRIYHARRSYVCKFIDKVSNLVKFDYYKLDHNIYNRSNNMSNFTQIESFFDYRYQSDNLKGYEGPFPYVDTFYVFDKITGTLYPDKGLWFLHSTSGDYEL